MTEGLDHVTREVGRDHWRDRLQDELEWPQETFYYKNALTLPKQDSQKFDTLYQHAKFPSWDDSDPDLWTLNRVSDPIEVESNDHMTSNTSTSKSRNKGDAFCRKFVCWFLVFTILTSGIAGVVLVFLLKTPDKDGQIASHHDNHIHQHLKTSEQEYLTKTFCALGKLLLKGVDYPTDNGVASCHTSFSVIENSEEIHIEMHLSPSKGFTVKEKFRRALMEQIIVDGLYRVNGTETFLQTDGTVFDPTVIVGIDTITPDASPSTPHPTPDIRHNHRFATPTTQPHTTQQCKCNPIGYTVDTAIVHNRRNNISILSNIIENATADADKAVQPGNNILLSDKKSEYSIDGRVNKANNNSNRKHTSSTLVNDGSSSAYQSHIYFSDVQDILYFPNTIIENEYVVNTVSPDSSSVLPPMTENQISSTSLEYVPDIQMTTTIDASATLDDYDYYWESSTVQHQSHVLSSSGIQPSYASNIYTESTGGSTVITKPTPTPVLENTHRVTSVPNAFYSAVESKSSFHESTEKISHPTKKSLTMVYRNSIETEITNNNIIRSANKITPTSSRHITITSTPVSNVDIRASDAVKMVQSVIKDGSFRPLTISKQSLSEREKSTSITSVPNIEPASIILPVDISTSISSQTNELSLLKSEQLTVPFDISNQLAIPLLNSSLLLEAPQETGPSNVTLLHSRARSELSNVAPENGTTTGASSETRKVINETATDVADVVHDTPPNIIPARQHIQEASIPNIRTKQHKSATARTISNRLNDITNMSNQQKRRTHINQDIAHYPIEVRESHSILHDIAHISNQQKRQTNINQDMAHYPINAEVRESIRHDTAKMANDKPNQADKEMSQMNDMANTGVTPPQVRAYKFFDSFNPLQVLMKMPGMNFQFG